MSPGRFSPGIQTTFPVHLIIQKRGKEQSTLLCIEPAGTPEPAPGMHSPGCLPVAEGSENMLVLINDDRPGHHQVIMLLPIHKSGSFSNTNAGVIPLPCDQDACIAWDYNGLVSVLDLSETVLEPETLAAKPRAAWEVIRTVDQNGNIIYQWYDPDGHLHVLSEWEFQRQLSMYFQSQLELLYPEWFGSALPAGGGWHRWQYKVRKAADRPGKDGQPPWRGQHGSFQRKEKKRKTCCCCPARPRPRPVQGEPIGSSAASSSSPT